MNISKTCIFFKQTELIEVIPGATTSIPSLPSSVGPIEENVAIVVSGASLSPAPDRKSVAPTVRTFFALPGDPMDP